MKIKNLELALNLKDQLDKAMKEYNKFETALNGGRWGEFQVHVTVSSDHYGNGRVIDKCIGLSRSEDAKKIVIEERDKAWGEVVRIRTELRSIGVEL